MATKASFTAEEWQQLLQSPMLAGMAVTAADPSGLFGLIKEGFAASRALAEAKADAGASALIKAVVADLETSEGRTAVRDGLKAALGGSQAADLKPKAIAALRRGRGAGRRQGARGCGGLQGVACGDRRTGRRGLQGGRLSWASAGSR